MTRLSKSLGGLPPKQVLALAIAERSRRLSLKAINSGILTSPTVTQGGSLHLTESTPYHILNQKARYKVLYGGRGGRKSWEVADYLIRKAAAVPIRWLCTREYQNSIKDSVHKLLWDTIYRLNLQTWFDITQTSIKSKIGGEFLFKGLAHNVQEIKSTEGLDGAWIEEGQNTTKNSFTVLDPTIRKPGSEIIITYNPDLVSDYIHKVFVANPEFPGTLIKKVGWQDNPDFPEELRVLRENRYSLILTADNDDERAQFQSDYDWIWEGECKTIAREIVFAGRFVVEGFPDDLWKSKGVTRPLFGADYGFSQDPATLIRMFILDNTLYIEYEAYGVGVELTEMEQLWGSVPGSRQWPIKADNARPETTSHMRGLGFAAESALKWAGSVEDGVTHIKGFRKVIIHPRCKHTIEEFKTYRYKVDRVTSEVLPIIIDKNNHCIDAIRYGLDGYIQQRGDLGIWAKLGREGK